MGKHPILHYTSLLPCDSTREIWALHVLDLVRCWQVCLNTCLNGLIDPGEECDDANTAACLEWPHRANVKDYQTLSRTGIIWLWRIPPRVFHVSCYGPWGALCFFHTACAPSNPSPSEFIDDGCANCIVEPGWSCPVPSKLSRHCKFEALLFRSKSVCPVLQVMSKLCASCMVWLLLFDSSVGVEHWTL